MDENKTIQRTAQNGISSGFFGPVVLEMLVPEMSKIKGCSAPDIREPSSSLLNKVLHPVMSSEVARPLCFVFVRRWTFAVSEYRVGKQRLSEYVSDLPRTNTRTSLFLAALGHFEHCVIQTYLALMTLRAVVRVQTRQKDSDAYRQGDGSPADRLGKLYNAIKHFNGRVESAFEEGEPSAYPAPVWITNQGLKCRHPIAGGRHEDVTLTFEELADLLSDLTKSARFVSRAT